jgi:hypothetical protein
MTAFICHQLLGERTFKNIALVVWWNVSFDENLLKTLLIQTQYSIPRVYLDKTVCHSKFR